MTEIKICNVVASVDFGQRLPLRSVGKAFSTPLSSKSKFPGIVVKLEKPKTANLIFSTGKMICTGSSSEYGARVAVRRVVDQLKRKGLKLKQKPQVKIQNMVALLNFGRNINLERAAKTLTGTIYEPEQFPGLIYQLSEPKTVALLFSNGKAVLTGARTKAEVEEAARKLEKILFKRIKRKASGRVRAKEKAEEANVEKVIKILEATYSLCEFCNYNCEACPYPNLGVYIEEKNSQNLQMLSSLSLVEKCGRGFYVKPRREVSLQVKFSKDGLKETLTRLFSSQTFEMLRTA